MRNTVSDKELRKSCEGVAFLHVSSRSGLMVACRRGNMSGLLITV